MEPIRPEFKLLDSAGLEYHRWVADVETTFVAKGYINTINDANAPPASEKNKVLALLFLKRHIDPNLRWRYLHLKTPKELWDALQTLFGWWISRFYFIFAKHNYLVYVRWMDHLWVFINFWKQFNWFYFDNILFSMYIWMESISFKYNRNSLKNKR